MTLAEFIALIRQYTGFLDPTVQTDEKITSWIRMAEERCSSDLRISDMIQIDTATIYQARVNVPNDWRANDFVRRVDGAKLSYKPRKEFYDLTDGRNYFTMSGRFMVFGGTPDAVDGKQIELHYFGDVPRLGAVVEGTEVPSWLAEKHQSLLINGTMSFAADSMVDNSVDWGARFDARVSKLNDEYKMSIGSGSGLSMRKGSFG